MIILEILIRTMLVVGIIYATKTTIKDFKNEELKDFFG